MLNAKAKIGGHQKATYLDDNAKALDVMLIHLFIQHHSQHQMKHHTLTSKKEKGNKIQLVFYQ